MKYLVKSIVNIIINEINNSSNEALFLVNEFEDLSIYVHVCRELEKYAKEKDKSITIKLAKNKWEYFKDKYAGSALLHTMSQNNWVLTHESTTEYRNKHVSDVLVLLGTESEPDSGGSLKDIFSINCSEFVEYMPTYKGRVDYSDLFISAGISLIEHEKVIVNKLYSDLFSLVNKDIYKLSKFVDDNVSFIQNVRDIVELFYKKLPIWGLPNRILNVPTNSKIQSTKKNILKSEYDFIEGKMFKDVAPSLKKYNKKIESYEKSHEKYNSEWDGWIDQPVKSYEEFTKLINDFILGNRSDDIKSKLLGLDFAIVEAILDIKLPTEKKSKSSTIKLQGSPLKVFHSAYLYALKEIRKMDTLITNIHFDFTNISLILKNKNDVIELTKNWKNLCIYTNGILEEIANYGYVVNDDDICLDYEPKDIFSIRSEMSDIVNEQSSNKKLNKINFFVRLFENEIERTKFEFEWTFSSNEDWLFGFQEVFDDRFIECISEPYIPLLTFDKINSLLMSKSEEEFFDYLDEKADWDFSCNILQNTAHHALFKEHRVYCEFIDVAEKFKLFIEEVSQSGLFYACSSRSNKATDFIKAYSSLGKKITETRFNENEYFILDLFIHAFNIEKNDFSVTNDKQIDCCIVPPWHPASVEKIKHKNLFFMDGCYNFWEKYNKNADINDDLNIKTILFELKELDDLSIFQNAVDIFPMGKSCYFGSINSYGNYSLYASTDLKSEITFRDLVRKDSVFDDDFNNDSYSTMTEDSYMIYDVIRNYITAFPNSKDKLNLVFIDPSDLQPIISSVNNYIDRFQKKFGVDTRLSINLSILVRPENKGGKNYISYWMNKFFDVDSSVNIKTYLNEWNTSAELEKLMNGNNDIVFVMDLLRINEYEFKDKIGHYQIKNDECYYPIVLRPSPISNTTTKRRIEITQPQFGAATIHTQVTHYRKNMEILPKDNYYAVKNVDIDEKVQDLVSDLHKKAYWVVCIDSSMDCLLLKKRDSIDYSVIGFSTGKGKSGQYNLTITARNSIVASIEKTFSKRLSKLFGWGEDLVHKAAIKCMKEASKLDGISVLTASNQRDCNIHEFMAYVLTSLRENEKADNMYPLKVIVHLDSYKHWFDKKNNEDSIFDDTCTSSRPDFLLLKVSNDFSEKIIIDATVIECKIAIVENKQEHLTKAIRQVKHGLDVLQNKFNPNSNDLRRRYWYAQLYRALTFVQISFNNASTEFTEISNKLRGILNGDFEIRWNSEILCYWLNENSENEVKEEIEENISVYNIPQQRMQKLILGSDENVFYSSKDFNILLDSENNSNDECEELELETYDTVDVNSIVNNDFINNIQFDILSENNQDSIYELNGSSGDSDSQGEINVSENQEETTDTNVNELVDEPVNEIEAEVISNIEVNAEDFTTVSNNCMTKLEDIRVLIGEDRSKQKVYWEFGNKQLSNRHMLITGTSGQGKTYGIQTLLYELSKNNISSIIFDYTEGFRLDQLETKFKDFMGDKLEQYVVKALGVPINPFKRHEMELAGMTMLESAADVAGRFASIFSHVYGFGDQQFASVFEATRVGIEKYGDEMNMAHFLEELELLKTTNKSAQSVISKIQPFYHSVTFNEKNSSFDWGEILYSSDSKVNIIQLTMIDREMQVIITELMLWDAWYYTNKYGSKDKPFVVVLDEAQNLSHKSNSPSAKILTEGRKFGWSAWFATQSLKILSDDEVVRLLQAAVKLYFKPTLDEVTKISKQLDPTDVSAWLSALKGLRKGQCIVVGDRVRNDGSFGVSRPTVTSVISFEERD